MRSPEPSAEQVVLLRIAYAAFRGAAKWPTAAYVDVVLDREHALDMEALLDDMPAGLVQTERNFASPSSLVVVSVAGLSFVDEAAEDIEQFVGLVRACAALERSGELSPSHTGAFEITQRNVVGEDHSPEAAEALVRAFRLVQGEALNWGSQGPDEQGNWSLTVNRYIRRYRDLTGIGDYLARRPDPPERRWVPAPVATPYAFVVMPFGETWSRNVNDVIRQACRSISNAFPGFQVERADEITEPGRITDQIVSAIERADILIADITGSNANVMFELGYADALNKPIVVLNQSVDETPFDIRDWRQIPYTQGAIGRAGDQLVDFVTGTLLRLGFERATTSNTR